MVNYGFLVHPPPILATKLLIESIRFICGVALYSHTMEFCYRRWRLVSAQLLNCIIKDKLPQNMRFDSCMQHFIYFWLLYDSVVHLLLLKSTTHHGHTKTKLRYGNRCEWCLPELSISQAVHFWTCGQIEAFGTSVLRWRRHASVTRHVHARCRKPATSRSAAETLRPDRHDARSRGTAAWRCTSAAAAGCLPISDLWVWPLSAEGVAHWRNRMLPSFPSSLEKRAGDRWTGVKTVKLFLL